MATYAAAAAAPAPPPAAAAAAAAAPAPESVLTLKSVQGDLIDESKPAPLEPPLNKILKANYTVKAARRNYLTVYYKHIVVDPSDPLNPAKNNVTPVYKSEVRGKENPKTTRFLQIFISGVGSYPVKILGPPSRLGRQVLFPWGNAAEHLQDPDAVKWAKPVSRCNLDKIEAKWIMDASPTREDTRIRTENPDGQDYYVLEFFQFMRKFALWSMAAMLLMDTVPAKDVQQKETELMFLGAGKKFQPMTRELAAAVARIEGRWMPTVGCSHDKMRQADGTYVNTNPVAGSEGIFMTKRLCYPIQKKKDGARVADTPRPSGEEPIVAEVPDEQRAGDADGVGPVSAADDSTGFVRFAASAGYSVSPVAVNMLVKVDGDIAFMRVPQPAVAHLMSRHGADSLVAPIFVPEARLNQGDKFAGRFVVHSLSKLLYLGKTEVVGDSTRILDSSGLTAEERAAVAAIAMDASHLFAPQPPAISTHAQSPKPPALVHRPQTPPRVVTMPPSFIYHSDRSSDAHSSSPVHQQQDADHPALSGPGLAPAPPPPSALLAPPPHPPPGMHPSDAVSPVQPFSVPGSPNLGVSHSQPHGAVADDEEESEDEEEEDETEPPQQRVAHIHKRGRADEAASATHSKRTRREPGSKRSH